MQTQTSNSKHKSKLLKFILTLLITLTAVQFTNPITTYADSANINSFNGQEEHGEGVKVGSLHWGGSTTRTGFIFYIADQEGDVLTLADLGVQTLTNGLQPIAIQVINSEYEKEFEKATDFEYGIHLEWHSDTVGNLTLINNPLGGFTPGNTGIQNNYELSFQEFGTNQISHLYYDDAPPAVKYNDATGKWSGNGNEIAKWLFTEESNGNQVWENIVIDGFDQISVNAGKGEEILKKLKDYQSAESVVEIAHSLTLVVEPIAVNAVYSFDTWGDEANTIELDKTKDLDFFEYIHPSNYKPVIDSNGKIVRILATAYSMAPYCYNLTGCETGGANSAWTNEALPFSITLQSDQLGIQAIPSSIKPEKLSYSTISDMHKSYGVGMLNKEIKVTNIHTYDIDNNPTEPAPSEQPSKDKDTTGDVTIVKLFYHATVDGLTGDVTWENTTKTTSGTTGYIVAQDESDKTGYRLQIWGTVSDEKSFSGYKYEDAYSRILKWKNHGESAGNIRISNAGSGDTESHKYVYLLYSKVTYLPAPQVQSYDFEIPESYITKQVYFSQANNTSNTQSTAQKLIQNTFKWTSQAHTLCPGHNVWSCTKDEHEHATDTMYAQGTVKCTKQEHSHSDGCLKKRYECKKCDAQEWYDWNAVTHTTSCPLTKAEKKNIDNYSIHLIGVYFLLIFNNILH